MIRRFFLISCLAAACALVGLGCWLGRGISFSQQWPAYEALRGTASIIFAVVGAWLAIIYPERLKLTFRPKNGESKGAANGNMWLLLTPAIHSTILLVVLLLIGVIVPMLKQIPVLLQYLETLRGLSFATLVALTCWQVAIVVITIFPAELLQEAAARERAQEEINRQHGKLFRPAVPKQ